MPLRIQISRVLTARSDRVKSVDIHPTEPWILSALYNGNVYIWNYQSQALVKSFEVTDQQPVRAGCFVARKGWIVVGADDNHMRVYNYNTMEKVRTWEAHTDYIRCVVAHPVQPYVLTSSDDMSIKLWDWEKNWANTMVFEGHTHYVMMIAINPKDTNTFASASLDRTVKVWGFNSPNAHFTLEGHEKGVNAVQYSLAGDKPYLVSGADDYLVKVWDYQNKTCVQTLEGHTRNVSVCCFHPEIPVIITGSEDGTVKMWNAKTYRLEKTLNYAMVRVWALAYSKGSNCLAIGYDEGTVMIKMGRDEPAMSMDPNGKVVWAKHNEIIHVNVKNRPALAKAQAAAREAQRAAVALDAAQKAGKPPTAEQSAALAALTHAAQDAGALVPKDGETLQVAPKDLGNCEIFPQTLKHNSNGRFVVVCGDGEYTIYTALAWRNKAFGSALEFVWAEGTGDYCVRESTSKLRFFKNFKEASLLRPDYTAEAIFGGTLLAVRSASFVVFYDWEQQRTIRRIDDVSPTAIYWSATGEVVTIACADSFFMLKYNKELVNAVLEAGGVPDDEGIEDAFAVLHEVADTVKTALWVGDCFVYVNANNRLIYCVGQESFNMALLEKPMYLLGYLPQQSALYLADKDVRLVSYTLHTSVVNYKTAVLRGDHDAAAKFLPRIPFDHRNRIAQFLESQGLKETALDVSRDPDQRFDLAVQLRKLATARDIAEECEQDAKWKQLGDVALRDCDFALAEECMRRCDDLNGLLLLYTSLGQTARCRELAATAERVGKANVAFVCHFLCGDVDRCLELLCRTGRVPEAAFMARTYMPSCVSQIVGLWRKDVARVNERAAEALADPLEYANLFPDLAWALRAEREFGAPRRYAPPDARVPFEQYAAHRDDIDRDLVAECVEAKLQPLEPAQLKGGASAAAAADGDAADAAADDGSAPAAAAAADADEPLAAAAEPVAEPVVAQSEPESEPEPEPEPVAEPAVAEADAGADADADAAAADDTAAPAAPAADAGADADTAAAAASASALAGDGDADEPAADWGPIDDEDEAAAAGATDAAATAADDDDDDAAAAAAAAAASADAGDGGDDDDSDTAHF